MEQFFKYVLGEIRAIATLRSSMQKSQPCLANERAAADERDELHVKKHRTQTIRKTGSPKACSRSPPLAATSVAEGSPCRFRSPKPSGFRSSFYRTPSSSDPPPKPKVCRKVRTDRRPRTRRAVPFAMPEKSIEPPPRENTGCKAAILLERIKDSPL